jgi:hypothetical protein
MFSLFKRGKGQPLVPAWASFISAEEYATFLQALENYFGKKNISYTLGEGSIETGPNDLGFTTLGLSNLAQICKQSELREYNGVVARHFDALLQANSFDKEFQQVVDDFEKVKKYIAVRLYHKSYAAQLGPGITMGKSFIGDIYAMLVFDLPHSVMNIQPEKLEIWGKSMEEVFAIGQQNIKDNYTFEISKQKFNDFSFWFVQAAHFFTPNIAFDLGNRKELLGPHGALVGMPHRHMVLIYPIHNLEIVKAINGLIPTIYNINIEGPGPVSNNLFWYKDGHFENLPYKLEEDKLQFIPPQNFVEMLNMLQE